MNENHLSNSKEKKKLRKIELKFGFPSCKKWTPKREEEEEEEGEWHSRGSPGHSPRVATYSCRPRGACHFCIGNRFVTLAL